jgi:hypothetical protein
MSESDKQKKKEKRKAAEALEAAAVETPVAGEVEKDKKKKKHKGGDEAKVEATPAATEGEAKEEKKPKRERVKGGISKIANPLAVSHPFHTITITVCLAGGSCSILIIVIHAHIYHTK